MAEPRTVEVSSGPIRYTDTGNGPVLVFVHGFFFSGVIWREVVRRLEDRFRCIVPDLPFGAHPSPMHPDADLSPTGIAGAVVDLCEALGLDRVTLVGNDTGDVICQLIALDHPDLVERVVLTNGDAYEHFPPPIFRFLLWLPRIPGALWTMIQTLRLGVVRRLPIAFGRVSARPLPGDVLGGLLAPSRTDRLIRRDLAKVLRGMDREVSARAGERLSGLRVPVLLAWAPEDRLFPASLAERLASDIPDARLEWVDGARMLVPFDRPDRLAELVAGSVRRPA